MTHSRRGAKNRVLLLASLFLLAGCATVPESYVDLKALARVGHDDLMGSLEDSRVIFIGEAHSSSKDHIVQLEVIRHLREKKGDITVALEMFPRGSQPVLDAWLGGRISEADFMDAYYKTWNMPYRYYRGIFRYAKKEGIPLAGVNAELGLIRNVAINGLDIVPESVLSMLMYKTCGEDPAYSETMGLSGRIESHQRRLAFHCDAQRLRDSFMAYNISRLLEGDERTVVVLLGAAHASRFAVPRLFEEQSGMHPAVLMPGSFFAITGQNTGADKADYLWH
jgi:uncharacterized iron-regulated protein